MFNKTGKTQFLLTVAVLVIGALFLSSTSPAYAARDDGGPNILPYTPPPGKAAISASPRTGAAPLTVSFEANVISVDNANIAYRWDFGTGDTSKEANPRYTFVQSGSYIVTLTVATSNEVFVGSTRIDVANPTRACAVNCLIAANINLKPVTVGDTDFVEATVLVVDEHGDALRGASVSGTWTLPDGRTVSVSAQTDGSGFAALRVEALQSGVYSLRIDGIAKAGYTFDASHSVRSGSLEF